MTEEDALGLSLGYGPRVVVCDYDRTLTDESLTLCKPVIEALIRLKKEHGIKVIVASGRKLSFLRKMLDRFHIVDSFVGENGAVVYLPHSARTLTLGKDVAKIKAALRDSPVPIDEGQAMVSTKRTFEEQVRRIIQEKGLSVEIQYNRDDLMILPAGIDKAAGVKEALAKLGLTDAELICIGDAENDLPLFKIAHICIATANAIPEVKDKADAVCMGIGGEGLARFLTELSARISCARS